MVFAVGPLDRDEWPLALGIAYALARARERKRSDWLLASAENWSSLFGFRPLWRDDRTPDATIRRVNPSEGATDCLCFDSPRQLGPSSVLTFFFLTFVLLLLLFVLHVAPFWYFLVVLLAPVSSVTQGFCLQLPTFVCFNAATRLLVFRFILKFIQNGKHYQRASSGERCYGA
jgi:hypothetical protein